MPDKKLQIVIDVDSKTGEANVRRFGEALDDTGRKGKKGFGEAATGLDGLKAKMESAMKIAGGLLTAFAAYETLRFGKKLSDDFIGAASAAESYTVRLNRLLGSQAEGNRMFREMSEYATKAPFEYAEIMESATALSGVMNGGVDEIKRWMPMIGDLAAVSGLSIQETTGQVVRMYSAGAASADLFRERGVLAMLGFQAGVSYSADETRKKMFQAWEATDSKFRDVTNDLSKTWKGTMSMFSDYWFQFRTTVMDAGPFDAMKEGFRGVLYEIERLKREGKLDEWAKDIADSIMSVSHSFTKLHAFTKIVISPFSGQPLEELKEAKELLESIRVAQDRNLKSYDDSITQSDSLITAYLKKQADAAKNKNDHLDKTKEQLAAEKEMLALNSALWKMQVDDVAAYDDALIKGNQLLDEYLDKQKKAQAADFLKDEENLSLFPNSDEWTLDEIEAYNRHLEETEKVTSKTIDLWENTRDTIQNSMSGFLSDLATNELGSFADAWKSALSGIADTWASTASQMIMTGKSITLGGMNIGGWQMAGIGAGIGLLSSIGSKLFGGDDKAERRRREAERAAKAAEMTGNLIDRIAQLELSDVNYQIDKLNRSFAEEAKAAQTLGVSMDLVIKKRQLELEEIIKQSREGYDSLLDQIEDFQKSKLTANWGVDEWKSELAKLQTEYLALDRTTQDYQKDSLRIFNDQFDVLKSIDRLQQDQLTATKNMIATIDDQQKSVGGWITRLTVGDLAPVQSVEGVTGQYETLKNLALSGIASGNMEGIGDFLSGITPYMDFMKGMGDYNTLVGGVVSDLYDINTGLANYKSAEVKAMETLTSAINGSGELTDSVGGNTTALGGLQTYMEKQFGKLTEDVGKSSKISTYQNFAKALDTNVGMVSSQQMEGKYWSWNNIGGWYDYKDSLEPFSAEVNSILADINAANAAGIDWGANLNSAIAVGGWIKKFNSKLSEYYNFMGQGFTGMAPIGDRNAIIGDLTDLMNTFPSSALTALSKTPSFAYGGLSTGPDSGYMATLHGTELIVSPRTSYPATVTAPAIDYDKLAQAMTKAIVPLITRNNDGQPPIININITDETLARSNMRSLRSNTDLITATKRAAGRSLS